ncbi:glycoside hydrolase family 15 protein [Mrakia frigida]|uniref:glycoside hydrolase family 15 protein n=1 Tax=Mrakia frigida TaxID=29902 RepID=UPI003FCC22C0
MAPINMFQSTPSDERIMGIQDYAMIGNLKTAAMVSLDGSIDSFCLPSFDSPSVFAKIVDKDKGGHFSITPVCPYSTKQAYWPSSNVLGTKFLADDGVGNVTDLLIPKGATKNNKSHLPWLIRRVEVIRGKMTFRVECAPAFDYARATHKTEIVRDDSQVSAEQYNKRKVLFTSKDLSIDLRVTVSGENLCAEGRDEPEKPLTSSDKLNRGENELDGPGGPVVDWQELDLSAKGHKGKGVWTEVEVKEGEIVTFVLRQLPEGGFKGNPTSEGAEPTKEAAQSLGVDLQTLARGMNKLRVVEDPVLSALLVDQLIAQTNNYWLSWISKSSYKGRWREAVNRQALTLKMLVFEETGAIIAAPTFSLPEHIGGSRNWDYRFTWIRDSSFTLYALIRLGYTDEANAFMEFIQQRLFDRNSDGSLQIMYTIRGEKDVPEFELNHLQGHKGSKPVRIGNGAGDHLQLDIYGELMDCIYLAQKFSKPLSWDMWVAVRDMVDWVCANWNQPDLSIWEVRNSKKNFLYSKIMLWVAIDRGLRLADKRSLPLPQRAKWLETRDTIYEEVMTKGWNKKEKFFAQAYESLDIIDSAVLIMPLTFFMSASDPRFRSTLDKILKSPEKGGLTSNSLVFRYDTEKADDGVGGAEGAFSLTTLWCIEALARAGAYEPKLLRQAVTMFEDFLGYGNHVGLYSEEISRAGEGLGNTPQGFSAVTLISTAYNLDRTLGSRN